MKKLLLFVLLILSSDTFSQSLLSWEWQNPQPQGNTIRSAQFVNPLIGYAITENAILMRTIDGGITWHSHSPSLGAADFTNVNFTDELTGYIVCKEGKILKTIDGGLTWTFQSSGTTENFTGVSFANSLTGYAAGDNGVIVKTTNGGLNWITKMRPDTLVNIRSIKVINSDTAFIVGRNKTFVSGAVPVFKTTDGGDNWIRQNNQYLYMIGNMLHVKNSNTIFAGGYTEMHRTTDGGANWHNVLIHAYATVNDMSFIDDTTGFVVATNGFVWKTTNGGTSWTLVNSASFKNLSYNAIVFSSGGNGFILGHRGEILNTSNSGNTWNEFSEGLRNNLVKVQFFDDFTGYAAGEQKTLLKTTDGGFNWVTLSALNSGANPRFYSMHFVDENTGYFGYSLGEIAKTTDGGLNFTYKSTASTQAIHAIYFTDADTGFAAGANNYFYRTQNGGTNWMRMYPDSGYFFGTFRDMQFLNSHTGFACNTNGKMYKTTNAGVNWKIDIITTSDTAVGGIYGIYFIDDSLGYGAGKNGKIIKTTNAGDNWTIDSVGNYHFEKIYFTNSTTGYASGRKTIVSGGGGAIVKTTDGGLSWVEQVTYTSSNIKSIVFTNDNIGYAAGDNGTILRTITAGDHPEIIINPTSSNLILTAFIQGFYNSLSNDMISDTAKVYLRNSNAPYIIVDSSKAKLNSSGVGTFHFSNTLNGNYYIILKHRNSIETWSSSGVSFLSGILTYDFTSSSNKAFGNNQIQIDTSPVEFGIYSGDVNQDGIVELTDFSLIDNDAFQFITGYVSTDISGDNFVDLSDIAIAENNVFNFVAIVRP